MDIPSNYNNLTWQERRALRQEYVRIQNGLCHHCAEPLTSNPTDEVQQASIRVSLFPPNFFNYPVHLHHHHKTGMTIGAVHCRCNAYLWQYKGE